MFFIASPAANNAPAAAFTDTCTNGGCAVDGSTSTDDDGTISKYEWDFGDGGTGTGVSLSHTYAQTGTYTIKLTVTDNKGATNSVSKSVSITSVGRQITFVGASHSAAGASSTKSATVPNGTTVGDTMVAVLTTPTGQGVELTGRRMDPGVHAHKRLHRLDDVGQDCHSLGPRFLRGGDQFERGQGHLEPGGLRRGLDDESGRRLRPFGRQWWVQPCDADVNATAGDTVVSFWTDKSAAVSTWTAPGSV